MTLYDMVRNLPTRSEDVMRAAGYRRDPGTMYSLSTSLGLLGLGVAVGAGMALLYAPETGQKLRRRLASRLDEAMSSYRQSRNDEGSRESAH
jgi:hypothetical protein